MDTPPLLYKSVHVTFVFWVPKTPPPHPIHVRHFCVSPPPRVNLENSCFMYFTKTSSNDENDNGNDNIPPIIIGATEIKRVSEIKFLGVVIDKQLSWDAHVKSLTKKLASCTLYRKHKSNCSIYTKNVIYEFILYTI